MSKSKFLYILPTGSNYRAMVKPSSFSEYPEGTKFSLEHGLGLPLSQISTDDLFKVKAQIASELENRMDLDEVTEANLEKLRSLIKASGSEVIAQLIRANLDRLDVVSADEKRAKTRLQILQDELASRMLKDGVSEMKFTGAVKVSYKQETVYSVGEAGWDTVYDGILAKVNSGVPAVEAFSILQKRLTSTSLAELVKQGEDLPLGVTSVLVRKLKVTRSK